jgi:predicted nucleic acid-binding protein
VSGFLLDTCAISEGTKSNPEAGAAAWLKAVNPSDVYLSVVTLGELRKGIELLRDRVRAARLEAWLTSAVPVQFAHRILAFDVDVADRWGRLIAALQRKGVNLSPIDSLIAATALHHNLSLVTRNEKDFKKAGVSITNPWSGRS